MVIAVKYPLYCESIWKMYHAFGMLYDYYCEVSRGLWKCIWNIFTKWRRIYVACDGLKWRKLFWVNIHAFVIPNKSMSTGVSILVDVTMCHCLFRVRVNDNISAGVVYRIALIAVLCLCNILESYVFKICVNDFGYFSFLVLLNCRDKHLIGYLYIHAWLTETYGHYLLLKCSVWKEKCTLLLWILAISFGVSFY